MFVGSIAYAAPEQFETTDTDVDGRADLHALGAILYELSTGQHPFDAGAVRATIQRIASERPRRAGELHSQLSPFFEEIVHTLLEKDREQRFGTAAELMTTLEEGESSPWWKERTRLIRLAAMRPMRRMNIGREAGLHGREAELAHLRTLFYRAQAGDGQVVLLEGEAGLGKTRLVDELAHLLRQEGVSLHFLFGGYPPGGGAAATSAFTTAFADHLGPGHLDPTLLTGLRVPPLLVPAFAALLRGDPPPQDAEPLSQQSLQTAFVHVARAIAAKRPVILLIDDLHFAPAEAMTLFTGLALATAGHPILLLGTMRPGLAGHWVADLVRYQHVSRIELSRLEPQAIHRLLADVLRSPDLARDLSGQVAARSDGNPYFLFELLGELRQREIITPGSDGIWQRAKPIEDIAVPSSLRQLVLNRIGTLAEQERELLDVAACWGFEFDPEIVAAALDLKPIVALKTLARIERGERLVRSVGRRYTFDHHHVQEVFAADLALPLREQYHAALAAALEARERAGERPPKEIPGNVAAALCEHFFLGRQEARGSRYLEPALSHLLMTHLTAAFRLADQALTADGLLDAKQRTVVLLRKAECLDFLGRRDEERETLEEALALAERTGAPRVRAHVTRVLGRHLGLLGKHEEARSRLTTAIELAVTAGDRAEEGTATSNLGTILFFLGQYEAARSLYERSLACFQEIGDRRGEAMALGNLGNIFRSLGRLEEARAHHERNLAMARETEDVRGEAIACGNLGLVHLVAGRFEEARIAIERHLAAAIEIGDRRSEVFATANLGGVWLALGRPALALEQYQTNLRLSIEIAYQRGEAIALGNLGQLNLALGLARDAREMFERAGRLTAAIGLRPIEQEIMRGLGGVFELEGKLEDAERQYRAALALCRELAHKTGVAEALIALSALLTRLGRMEEVEQNLGEALALARELDLPGPRVMATARLALLNGGDAGAAAATLAADEYRLTWSERTEGHFLVWKSTGERRHLAEAHRLMLEFCEHAPLAARRGMIERLPLYREIELSWKRDASSDRPR
jgi:tetratricopeptide (TPR) repeat protein